MTDDDVGLSVYVYFNASDVHCTLLSERAYYKMVHMEVELKLS